MSLIVTRTPYFISNNNYDDGAILSLEIGYYGFSGSFELIKSYSLSFDVQKYIDVSPLVNDFYTKDIEVLVLRTALNGSINDVVQSEVNAEYICVEGAGYYEDGFNPNFTGLLNGKSFYAGSNDYIQAYADGTLTIPLLSSSNVDSDVTINYLSGGVVVATITNALGYSIGGEVPIQNGNDINIEDGVGQDLVTQVLIDGVTENWETYKRLTYVSIDATGLNIDQIQVISSFNTNTHTITVESISECKYTPYKVRFRNKYGALEDLWFFKKSTESISTEKKRFNKVIFDDYANGDLSRHSMKQLNVNGMESKVLNTGYVPESFNENIRQMMLSEEVYLIENNIELPVNVSVDSFEFKKHVNDKLINFTVSFEYAYQKLNNIV